MYKLFCSILLLLAAFQLNAQYKNDNVLYKTVYAEDLAQQLKANPGYLLLDVRSKGENQDTSSMQSMNIGHFRDARNIDVRELGTRLNELQGFKNTPIFVYCSHSQRSRRASKMLSDSGFTKVYNINGGMTTLLQNQYGLNTLYETKKNYQFLSPAAFCNELSNKNSFILDVRSDTSYNASTMSELTNAIGRIKSASHIPLTKLESSLAEIPMDKKIVLVDDFGDESINAAVLLNTKGYKNVAVLFDGMYNLITSNTAEVNCKKQVVQQNKKYTILSADEFNGMMTRGSDAAIIDARTTIEFNNQAKEPWKNTGHIKNAINIPASELETRMSELSGYKTRPVIVYGFGSFSDAYSAAAKLQSNGFNNVNVLSGGIFGLRWRAANIKGKSSLKDWVTDIPVENL
ncbi:MAG: rhodanese-like domain-containing protein [Ginsengibacter sp.]